MRMLDSKRGGGRGVNISEFHVLCVNSVSVKPDENARSGGWGWGLREDKYF